MTTEQNNRFWDKGLIIFTIICIIIAVTVVYIILFPYANSEFDKAKKDLNQINSCTNLVFFNSHLNDYKMNIWNADDMKKLMESKSETLKCP